MSFSKRLNSMFKTDLRRMLTTPHFYIMAGAALVMPILILVMTSSLGGGAFSSVWQIIGSDSSASMATMSAMNSMGGGAAAGTASQMDMSAMTSMININLMYFLNGIFLCLFISEDFKSGYAKNLFTVRSGKLDYVASKTIIGFISGAVLLIEFFLGTVLGGAFAGISFGLGSSGAFGLIMCLLAKIFLMTVFNAIFIAMSVIGKQRSWMSILLSLFAGMLLFMMIPMLTPIDSGFMNLIMCAAGGGLFGAGVGAVSNLILKKVDLV